MFLTRSVNFGVYLSLYLSPYLSQMESAFAAGYDPALELAKSHTPKKAHASDTSVDDPLFGEEEPWTQNLRRKEQDVIDFIIHGEESGHYFMLLGPKVCSLQATWLLILICILRALERGP